MNELPAPLRRLHARVTGHPFWQRLHLASRLLLAMAFLPTGLVKVMGYRFTSLPVENPVGFFFEAMYQSGWYWNFLGWGQVTAAILLILPRTHFLGAILFLPILVNVVAVTWSIDFGLTGWITLAMLVANAFLLCWEADRVWPAMSAVLRPRPSVPLMSRMEAIGWTLGGGAGMLLFLATRGFAPDFWFIVTVVCAITGAVLVLLSWLRGARTRPGPAMPGGRKAAAAVQRSP
jgi:hypothetical protein